MIHSSFAFKKWDSVPVSSEEEVRAPHASLTFHAETSLSEKVGRVFNDTMFLLVGAKLLSKIPGIGAGVSHLARMGFSTVTSMPVFHTPQMAAIMANAPKIIMALAVLTVIRKILSVAINLIVYPVVAESYISNKGWFGSTKGWYDGARWKTFKHYLKNDYACHRVALNKSGIDYDAFAFEHKSTKGNGKWVILAGGNGMIGETSLYHIDSDPDYNIDRVGDYKDQGFNVLYVNGPGVGRSTGAPTSYSIAAGQEAGLQFLEKVVGAKKILMYGLSLGGGAQAEAVLSHNFNMGNVDYLVWSDRTFDYLSNAASAMVTHLAKPIFAFLGIELKGVLAEKKLEKLGIKHIITQHSHSINQSGILPLTGEIGNLDKSKTDGVIPDAATLYVGIRRAGFKDDNRIKCFGGPKIHHNGALPGKIKALVDAEIVNVFG